MTGTLNVPLQAGERSETALESAVGLPNLDKMGAAATGRNCSWVDHCFLNLSPSRTVSSS
jgi:hypothetical protein